MYRYLAHRKWAQICLVQLSHFHLSMKSTLLMMDYLGTFWQRNYLYQAKGNEKLTVHDSLNQKKNLMNTPIVDQTWTFTTTQSRSELVIQSTNQELFQIQKVTNKNARPFKSAYRPTVPTMPSSATKIWNEQVYLLLAQVLALIYIMRRLR